MSIFRFVFQKTVDICGPFVLKQKEKCDKISSRYDNVRPHMSRDYGSCTLSLASDSWISEVYIVLTLPVYRTLTCHCENVARCQILRSRLDNCCHCIIYSKQPSAVFDRKVKHCQNFQTNGGPQRVTKEQVWNAYDFPNGICGTSKNHSLFNPLGLQRATYSQHAFLLPKFRKIKAYSVLWNIVLKLNYTMVLQ